MYELSTLSVATSKSVFVGPLVVASTQSTGFYTSATKTFQESLIVVGSKDYFDHLFWRIWRTLLSAPPRLTMMVLNMLSIIFIKFKVLNTIIRLNLVNMVDSFFLSQFASDMFLHDVAVLKDSLTVHVYPHIPKFSYRWLVILKNPRTFRDVITFIPKPTATVHLAYLAFGYIKNSGTTLYSTYLAPSHTNIITGRIN